MSDQLTSLAFEVVTAAIARARNEAGGTVLHEAAVRRAADQVLSENASPEDVGAMVAVVQMVSALGASIACAAGDRLQHERGSAPTGDPVAAILREAAIIDRATSR